MTAPVASSTRPRERLSVAGLAVTRWPAAGGAAAPGRPDHRPPPTVVALPGLSSTSAVWSHLAASVPDRTVISPDLRGRGGSLDVKGRPGLRAHADDVARILEELDLTDVVLVGHSMGAYLALVVASVAAGRARSLVLLDGGIRPQLPFFMGPALVRAKFRHELGRVNREWPDAESFADRAKLSVMVAARPDLRDEVMSTVREELGGEPGRLRPRIDVDRAVEDAVDTFFGPDLPEAVDSLDVPARVILATNARKPRQRPFISGRAVRRWVLRQPRLDVIRIAGNHLTVLFAPEVRAAVTS